MPRKNEPDVVFLFTTLTARYSLLRKWSRELVKERLAACVSFFPVESHYEWKGKLCQEKEMFCFIKTRKEKLKSLESYFAKKHPYELPEWVVLKGEASLPYANWVRQQTK